MKDLGTIVLLAGPNGGGKSRFLRLLEEARQAAVKSDSYAKAMPKWLEEVKQREIRVAEKPANEGRRQNLENHQAELETRRRIAESPPCMTIPAPSEFTVILLPPISGNIDGTLVENINVASFSHWKSAIGINPQEGRGRIVYHLAGVVHTLHQAKHPDHHDDPELQEDLRRALGFCKMVKELLGITIAYTLRNGFPSPTLNGRPFNPSELSTGQAVLLGWAIVIETRLWTEQRGISPSDQQFVIALDEPENHLHPHAAVTIIRRLINYMAGRGQLWIATHSPTILASFADIASLYHVAEGRLEYAGSNPTKVIEGLVGGEDERHMLRDMLDDADRVVFYKFAAECLQNALVFGDADHQDPQSQQLTHALRARTGDGQKCQILDYASGKARFAMALADLLSPDEKASVDYRAYDDPHYDTHRDDKLRNIARLYPNETPDQIATRTTNRVSDHQHDSRVDLVVLCNTLHEIEVKDWLAVFRNVHSVLADDGVLLILEDLELPVGELPNPTGFLVLDLDELRALFGSTKQVMPLAKAAPARCSAVVIAREALAPLVADAAKFNLDAALKQLKTRALREIAHLRSAESSSYKHGRAHARAAMLLANVELALHQRG